MTVHRLPDRSAAARLACMRRHPSYLSKLVEESSEKDLSHTNDWCMIEVHQGEEPK